MMSTDEPGAVDGLEKTGPPTADDDTVQAAFDPLADTTVRPPGGLGLPPADPLHDSAKKAQLKAKLFGSAAAGEAPKVGRYSILKILGEGGMGTVYACFDDQLDRRVALKLVKGVESEEARKRMLREAQAMAQLSHPNVVPVFEVGEHKGQLFVAMEYVKGVTLAQWQTEEERDWRDVLDKYRQAGRGLAAAHAEGLVHRDFKPHNAVVGTDGRVRVLDFGLAAKRGQHEIADTRVTLMPQAKDAALDTPLTEAGRIMGTPAYMSLEQFLGDTVDARSDQFSFCVALWEGLYGERPFSGKTTAELSRRVAQGKVADSKRSEMPTAIRAALERGLRPAAEDRWPDLAALLAEFESIVGAARRRLGLIVGLLVAVVVLAFGYGAVRLVQSAKGEAEQAERDKEDAERDKEDAEQAKQAADLDAERKAEQAKQSAELRQRNALLVSVAREFERVPTEAAAMLREVRGADLAGVLRWKTTSQPLRSRSRDLRAILEGHTGIVSSASFSPDGKRIVTASADKTVRVWNADGSGSPLILEGHTGHVFSASFSPDGRRIVTASRDKTARVWNADGSGSPLVLGGHTGMVSSASFSPDGGRIVTASFDKTARVWNADGRGSPLVLEGHTGMVYSAHFSPDGERIVTASFDKTARVWNADGTGSPVVLEGHTGYVSTASFSPDGRRIVTAAFDSDKTARVWNADGTGSPLVLEGHTDGVKSASFSPDGRRIVTASWDKTARVWNADGSGSPVVLEGHTDRVYSASFSPDGRRIVTASGDKTARVWNADGSRSPVVLEGHDGPVGSPSFSPDGRRIVTASPDETARVWNTDGSGSPVVLEGHTGPVWSASFGPDGRRIVTASLDRTARVWSADGSGSPVVLEGHASRVILASFSPDGRRIVTASRDKTARVWNADGSGSPVVLEGHSGPVGSASFSPDGGRIVTASGDKTARVWNADGSGSPVVLEGHTETVRSASFSPDGRRIVTGSPDKTARVWNADGSGSPLVLEGHTDRVRSASFSPDGSRIVTASWDKTARLWSLADFGRSARTTFWQTPFCHTPRIRAELLGESEALARDHYERCIDLTALCTREEYETCHEAVTRVFAM